MQKKLLEVNGLKTYFKIGKEWAKAIDGLDFEIYEGEILGIVGESGSGKSVTSLSLIQLIPNPPGEISDGEIIFKGEKIFDGSELQKVKEKPRYKFFGKIKEAYRYFIFALSLIAWIIILAILPISFLPFVLLLLGFFGISTYIWFKSPLNKALRDFRNKIYTRIRDIRGREIAMIFQEPMTSLNPVFTVGMQILESLEAKSLLSYTKDWIIGATEGFKESTTKTRIKVSGIFAILVLFISQLISGWTFALSSMITASIVGALIPILFSFFVIFLDRLISKKYHEEREVLFNRGVKLLDAVGIPDPELRMHDFPHQFSGGMRQRAMIAMALAKKPSLLIADEPTTALDVTIQAQILELMKEVKDTRTDAAIVLITHDLAVIAEMCERVIVMYGGMIQEVAEIIDLFTNTAHPYTRGLLNSIPHPEKDTKLERLDTIRGMVPNILNFPDGCKFCTRCDDEMDICNKVEPELIEISPKHFVRCHLYKNNAEKQSTQETQSKEDQD